MRIRPAKPGDAENCYKAVSANRTKNGFENDLLKYPNVKISVVENNDQALVFSFSHTPLLLDSLGINPAAEKHEIITALRLILAQAIEQAREQGCGEIIFAGSEPSIPRLAKHVGFEELPYKFYRLKVNYGVNENSAKPPRSNK